MINERGNKAVNAQPPALNEGSASKKENLSSVVSYVVKILFLVSYLIVYYKLNVIITKYYVQSILYVENK